jgi:hypothetical protein
VLANRTHPRRSMTLQEMANVATFMASDQASGITGATVNLTMGRLDDWGANASRRFTRPLWLRVGLSTLAVVRSGQTIGWLAGCSRDPLTRADRLTKAVQKENSANALRCARSRLGQGAAHGRSAL